MDNLSYLSNTSSAVIESMYEQYRQDPGSVDFGWRKFFEGFEFSQGKGPAPEVEASEGLDKEIFVLNLINAYRIRGHLFTATNPVRERRKYRPTLDLENFHLSDDDLDTVFQAGSELGIGPSTLRTIVAHLQETYCQSIGAEFRYMADPDMVEWLQERMESKKNTPAFSIEEKKHILRKLNHASMFENFLHTKFVGQKRFSLEGAETLIPALDAVIEKGATQGIEEFVVGMAHRGRLNVLANIFGKTYTDIFGEFEGRGFDDSPFDGDVKYHLGFSSDVVTDSGRSVHLSMPPNPSHLEAVDPVVEGAVRAKIDNKYGGDFTKIAPILIHGDASIAGQGVVYEVIQMSLLDAYKTGGTIHLVINNQIGFTTNYLEGRSSTYCTDVAKVTKSPVFHVNGDDVEAVVAATILAMEFRQKFQRDVFIDLLCYRKYGHNEGDDPRYTQPKLYETISNHPNPREVYSKQLVAQGDATAELVQEMESEFHATLQERFDESKQIEERKPGPYLDGSWSGMRLATREDFASSPDTTVPADTLRALGHKMLHVPEDHNYFKKIRKLFGERVKMLDAGEKIDWAVGEWLAYATLLAEGTDIRMSGQDCERGTFSHRHAVLRTADVEDEYVPLNHVADEQGTFEIYNSFLSEYGVLGFEFGYAMAEPQSLVLWEAQFGDFVNGAQIVIDQFISCSETKWQRMNGLVMLLPHGYEGQGPEHSSARPERFLNLCANNNMQVVNCTTPANFFHALRRQLHRPFRLPLVVMTPKSLLRHPRCTSSVAEFSDASFREVIDDAAVDAAKVKRVLLCSGKVYYDLLAYQEEQKRTDVAVVRLEQFYPYPREQLAALHEKYGAAQWCWVQEEPENMGGWSFMLRKWEAEPLQVFARKASATPATGFHAHHVEQQAALVTRAFTLDAGKKNVSVRPVAVEPVKQSWWQRLFE